MAVGVEVLTLSLLLWMEQPGLSRFRPALRMVPALSAPLLILLAVVSMASRRGTQRLEAVPALVIGTCAFSSIGATALRPTATRRSATQC